MVLYLFDKLQYEIDEIIIKWNLNDVIIDEDIINIGSVNYMLKLIFTQLGLFVKIFEVKFLQIEGSISDDESERKLVEIHDLMISYSSIIFFTVFIFDGMILMSIP